MDRVKRKMSLDASKGLIPCKHKDYTSDNVGCYVCVCTPTLTPHTWFVIFSLQHVLIWILDRSRQSSPVHSVDFLVLFQDIISHHYTVYILAEIPIYDIY